VTDIWSESVVLSCVAHGLPMPDIIWMNSNGKEIYDSDRVNITHEMSYESGVFETSSSLRIFYPSNLDAGAYYCLADNSISMATQEAIVLLVFGMLYLVAIAVCRFF